MKLSRTISYAVKATLALSEARPGATVNCKDLADAGEMPDRFLLQILRSLVTHGILKSTRGAKGGFALNRPPDEISLLDVIEAVDGPVHFTLPPASSDGKQLQHELQALSERIRSELAELKLSQLVDPDRLEDHLRPQPNDAEREDVYASSASRGESYS